MAVTTTRQQAKLKAFARHVIRECVWNACECGGDLQDVAEEMGLIESVPGGYDPVKHGENIDAEPGDTYYVFAKWLRLKPRIRRVEG